MSRKRNAGNSGMTLVEVTIAMAIFAAVMAVSAQALGSFYVGVDLQKERVEAVNSCRAVMSFLREKRHELSAGFPEGFLGFVGSRENAGWPEFLDSDTDGPTLDNHSISVACQAMDGSAASVNTNPLQVQVTSTWTDKRGRTLRAQVVSVLTDQ
ncbi:MAG: type II secretion system protein J [Candidatus Hydrogenedentota bacterium]